MVKRKAKSQSKKTSLIEEKYSKLNVPPVHDFTEEEIKDFQNTMVTWYQENKRDLPWRQLSKDPDINKRAYSVWVSEIMLQQTQVATVIDYYNKWIEKWPTLQHLAKANLEEVNEMWSGLGYYSRGRRLYEGAQKIVNELNSEMPRNAESLIKELPGVGRYTAGAIASIAYNEQTGLVDGNVIRVLSRLRVIGTDSTSQIASDTFWSHANKLVPVDHPGDFNQAMMELGATICTPKSPSCSTCPVQSFCKAFKQVESYEKGSVSKFFTNGNHNNNIPDIECLEEECKLCLNKAEPWDLSLGVSNYPRKGKKKESRVERTRVCVIKKTKNDNVPVYFITQRPEKGLLAGLWEFPSQLITDENDDILETLKSKFGISLCASDKRRTVGEVVHIFSHINQTYVVETAEISDSKSEISDGGGEISDSKSEISENSDSCIENINCKWVTKEEFLESAVSTGMKKVFRAYENSLEEIPNKGVKRKRSKIEVENKNQPSISSFFKTKS